ncbi:single-stranded-DNA-specific exonuclease RecJ [Desulfohalobium retbaense]|uniref:Single-stranded-DNA-specific exonuclease RecJ n=1 Tax=Desulfohalobium retbaense (strain ATCC 49708 / DSM 5692 / JCM 16813 / HR100) TaxID=485915 RepID=C8WZW9_DESRD|nr:single-stranded-DNA-specific exonuclease RecJ [Desulfohalobium retbaense]ACV67594.1 single-stranded-DNA-specific exonuclease RecJ [Desulfohalobium retbaense DSM 5692]
MPNTQWIFREQPASEKTAEFSTWAKQLEISPFLCDLLWQRGLSSPQEMDVFLSPGLRHLAPPHTWSGLNEAAAVLAAALEQDTGPLAVWGDYDVDGITATALVTEILRGRGYAVLPHLPNRMEDGYGLNTAGIEALYDQGVRALLTVDCGMGDLEAITRAKELGMRVVVSDHHQPHATLPPADAIVNPCVDACPCPELAGVGTAFFLMAALNRLLPGTPSDLRPSLDLVALGTIADVVSLRGQNRIVAKNGLLLLSEGSRPGIYALKEASRLPGKAPIGAGQVAFGLAPRINAAGRMGSATEALDLLLAPDLATAQPLAAKLEAANQERRTCEDGILEQAVTQVEERGVTEGLVLADAQWHQGIIGIVASRVVERFYRPTILLTRHNGYWKGSGRSIVDVDLHAALTECADLLAGFGGHPQAAGLSLTEANLKPFTQRFSQAISKQLGGAEPLPRLKLDGHIPFGQIDLDLIREIELLQPFGMGNPQPVFCSEPLQVQKHNVFGKKHVSLQLQDPKSGIVLTGKAWRQAEALTPSIQGETVQLAFTPRLNHYQGLTSIDLDIKDWRLPHDREAANSN